MTRFRFTTVAAIAVLSVAAVQPLFAQSANSGAGRARVGQSAGTSGATGAAGATAVQRSQIPDELWTLLEDWARASAQVKKLHGKHVRRAYDHTFKIEKIAQGEFWYASPDKGRIDVKAVQISARMLAERNDPKAQVQRDKTTGKPYDLKSDLSERWICDGEKVYDINDKQKSARVVRLPPDIRGVNIMDSPLPFLFGMPPEKAVQRFNMTIAKDYRPKYDVVLLEATPRLRKDADNWSRAKIFLDTRTYLPTGVQLVNPAGTKDTRYTFQDMEVNKSQGFLGSLIGDDPWDPKIGKDYDVHMITSGQQQDEPAVTRGNGPTVPNVVAKAHDVATSMLLQAGIKREDISKQNAGPAPRSNLTYLVREQTPKAGTPLQPGQKIVLKIFDKPKVTGASTGSASRGTGTTRRQ